MARSTGNQEFVERFHRFYRNYCDDDIADLAQHYPSERRSLYVDYDDLYRFDGELAEDVRAQPDQMREYAEEALRQYDLPVDVKLGRAHVRIRNLPDIVDIREIRVHDDHIGRLVAVQGIVRKATDVRPKITEAAFECQRCGTMTYIPQTDGSFQEPHECQGCERQGPFRVNFDQSEFVDSQKLRVQESPEGLRGGETPQSIDVNIEDDVTGEVTAGDHVTVSGILHIEQMDSGGEKSPVFDLYMDGVAIEVEDEQFENMDIDEDDVADILELSEAPDIYERMVDSIAPTIYGYEQEKLAMALQLFSGVTKHLPDGSRLRGDLHMLLIGDPGTGKSQLLSYIRNVAPRSVYTSGKGSSAAGLTAAAVRDDFGDGQQWTLEAGALVLADKGIAAIDELDKMRCVTGDTLVHLGDGTVQRIRELAREAAETDEVEELPNGRTIRGVGADAWTMTDAGDVVRRPVTAIHEYDAPDDLTAVRLESGERLTTTHDHPFFVAEGGERIERPAADLAAGDWVYVPRGLPIPTGDGGLAPATTSDPECGPERPADAPSPALGAVLGYLSGDGNVYYDRSAGSYGISFTNGEEQLLADFERACTEAFDAEPIRPPSERRDDGVETVRLSGKAYAEAALEAGMNLETNDDEAFPTGVTDGGLATKAAFVRALADSEGSVDTVTGTVRIVSASYDLLLGTKSLLLEFGVSSRIQTRHRPEKRDVHVLAVTAADSLRAYNRHVGFTLDRKRRALDEVCDAASGDRTIIDVIPGCGDTLASLRESLRLHQSECGLVDATYCNFENEDANVSIHRARTILDAFESRQEQAETDLKTLGSRTSWETLDTLVDRYHVSQSELSEATTDTRPRLSREWGADDALRSTVRRRLRTIVGDVATTDLAPLRERVRAGVKWRRVDSVETVSAGESDDRVRIRKHDLADRLGCQVTEAVERARALLDRDVTAETWVDLRSELDRYGIPFRALGADLDVARSTVSRWFDGVVETDRFEDVRAAALARIEEERTAIAALLDEIEARREPKVYDLTVQGTHNFVANGTVVHNSEDRSAMHQGLEQQEISISKAGINATLKSRCSLLGAANPKHGRFDQYEPIGEQIDLEPALISRFDLIFTVTDQPDPDEDARLAEHILDTNYAGELRTQRAELSNAEATAEEVEQASGEVQPAIDPDLFRKYIAYAKRSCFPRMTDEAQETIRDFYVDMRSRGIDEDSPVPITARKIEALVRLSEASARVRLSDTVEAKDAERVVDIVQSSMEDIGVDPETGQFDADVIETGTSKSQRDRIKNLKELIQEIEEEYEEGAPVDRVLERAEEVGMDPAKAEGEIENLKKKGEVYEPSLDHLRTT